MVFAVPQLHTGLVVDYSLSMELEACFLHFCLISANGSTGRRLAVGQGEKKGHPDSDGNRDGGSFHILASNISATDETGLIRFSPWKRTA